jgi:hypothetical protein
MIFSLLLLEVKDLDLVQTFCWLSLKYALLAMSTTSTTSGQLSVRMEELMNKLIRSLRGFVTKFYMIIKKINLNSNHPLPSMRRR